MKTTTNPGAATVTFDFGNNESASTGIVVDGDEFTALTFTESKTFKTAAGAAKWLAKRGYLPNGEKA